MTILHIGITRRDTHNPRLHAYTDYSPNTPRATALCGTPILDAQHPEHFNPHHPRACPRCALHAAIQLENQQRDQGIRVDPEPPSNYQQYT
jgi:hypothetical protein